MNPQKQYKQSQRSTNPEREMIIRKLSYDRSKISIESETYRRQYENREKEQNNIGYTRAIQYAKQTKVSLSAIRKGLNKIDKTKVEPSTLFDNRILNRLICDRYIKISSIKQQFGDISNIEFYDGYYSVVIPHCAPMNFLDKESLWCLNLLKKYFEKYLSKFYVYYTDNAVLGIEPILSLDKYILHLKNTIEKPKCEVIQKLPDDTKTKILLSYPKDNIEKEIKYRNIYIDYLSVLHNYKRIYKCWENINGKYEDSFIFSVQLRTGNIAIFYENISFARASEVFITTVDNYETCIKSVFSFFSSSYKEKRDAIRCHRIPETEFNVLSYRSIIHFDINYWQLAIDKIISAKTTKAQQTVFDFNIGLKVSKNRNATTIETKEYKSKNIHNRIIRQLYKLLNNKYPNNVGTEIHITDNKRVDLVVRLNDDSYAFYEIKSYDNPAKCIQEGIGQLMQYKFLVNKIINVSKLVIVGVNEPTDDIINYLKMYNSPELPIEYMFVDLDV